MFERILVAVDGSAHGNRAVAVAAQLATCHNSVVHLLHVIRDFSLPKEILEMISAGEVTASRLQILQDSAHIILGKAGDILKDAGVAEVRQKCLMGDPAARILEYAAENGADLIILGKHGLGMQGGLLGGVARKIVNATTIACLIVA